MGRAPEWFIRLLQGKQNRFADPIDEVVNHRFQGMVGEEPLSVMKMRLENNPAKEALFDEWLCNYLQHASDQPIQQVKLLIEDYKWEKGKFVLTGQINLDSISCSH